MRPFVGLHQPQVAFGQRELGIVRQTAEYRLGKPVVAGAPQGGVEGRGNDSSVSTGTWAPATAHSPASRQAP